MNGLFDVLSSSKIKNKSSSRMKKKTLFFVSLSLCVSLSFFTSLSLFVSLSSCWLLSSDSCLELNPRRPERVRLLYDIGSAMEPLQYDSDVCSTLPRSLWPTPKRAFLCYMLLGPKDHENVQLTRKITLDYEGTRLLERSLKTWQG